MDKISVIVPAYNCQDTIEHCINSIQNQTYKDLEIIIVNDGSTDNTEQIISDLQSVDNRIKVFTIPNGGVSHARNTGIDNATGDYITFVDSDDYIDTKMYETLYSLIKEYNVKIAHCSYKNVDGKAIVPVGDTGKITVQNHDEALKCLLSGRLFIGGLCNKLYNRILFNNIHLEESIKFNEDILANYYLFDKVEESVYIDRAFYSYVANETSATHTISSVVSRENVVMVARIIEKESIGKPYHIYAEKKLAYTLLDLYRAYLLNKDKSQKKEELKRELKDYKLVYKSKNEKTTYYLAMYFPHICVFTYKIYDRIRVKKLDPAQ